MAVAPATNFRFGHKRTFAGVRVMTALPPKVGIAARHFRTKLGSVRRLTRLTSQVRQACRAYRRHTLASQGCLSTGKPAGR
jgi:hypothetical protein